MDARLHMSGMTEGGNELEAWCRMWGMTTMFCHPRRLLAGIHPYGNQDGFPITNVGKTKKVFSRLTPHFLLFTSSYDRLRIAMLGMTNHKREARMALRSCKKHDRVGHFP
jgi:hypothetical protein